MPANLALLAPIDPLIRSFATNHGGERPAMVGALERTPATAKANFRDLADIVGAGTKPRIERQTSPPHRWRAPAPDARAMLANLLNHLWVTDCRSFAGGDGFRPNMPPGLKGFGGSA
jgi:hypothetical protein